MGGKYTAETYSKWGFTRLLNVLSVAFNWLNHEDSPSQNKIDLDDFPVIVMAMLCGELLVIQAPYVVAYRLLCNKIHTSSYIHILYTRTYVNTCIHEYMNTIEYIHPYIHAYIPTYLHTDIPRLIHTSIQTYHGVHLL
jgi:hypothetical protein